MNPPISSIAGATGNMSGMRWLTAAVLASAPNVPIASTDWRLGVRVDSVAVVVSVGKVASAVSGDSELTVPADVNAGKVLAAVTSWRVGVRVWIVPDAEKAGKVFCPPQVQRLLLLMRMALGQNLRQRHQSQIEWSFSA